MSIIVWNTSSVGRIPSPRAKGTTITKILNRGRSKRSRRLSPPPFPAGQTAGDYDTIAKLTRVTMLAPVVMALRIIAAHAHSRCGWCKPQVGAKVLLRARLHPSGGGPQPGRDSYRANAWIVTATAFLLSSARPQWVWIPTRGSCTPRLGPAGARRDGLGLHHRPQLGGADRLSDDEGPRRHRTRIAQIALLAGALCDAKARRGRAKMTLEGGV